MWISLISMFISMGFYQLGRLHYCFANSQIHSDKGYPKWLFIVMYIIGIFIAISFVVLVEMLDDYHIFNSKCGINDKFEFYYQPKHVININISGLYYIVISICAFVWDLFTLYLYISKIRSFMIYKDKHPSVYKRIQYILQKIFILTMLYQMTGLILMLIVGPLDVIFNTFAPWAHGILTGIIPLIVSLSMYLMMDHNVKEYIRFLKVIQFLKLNYLCCQWRYFVVEQLECLDENVQNIVIEEINESRKSNIETRNKSVMDHKIDMPEVSVPTLVKG